ncbi:MAG TPA: hypothetical protein VFA85_09425 [Terriglobales bacterium]|nr:hypothetical protein [Terriglobales bacterium]
METADSSPLKRFGMTAFVRCVLKDSAITVEERPFMAALSG